MKAGFTSAAESLIETLIVGFRGLFGIKTGELVPVAVPARKRHSRS